MMMMFQWRVKLEGNAFLSSQNNSLFIQHAINQLQWKQNKTIIPTNHCNQADRGKPRKPFTYKTSTTPCLSDSNENEPNPKRNKVEQELLKAPEDFNAESLELKNEKVAFEEEKAAWEEEKITIGNTQQLDSMINLRDSILNYIGYSYFLSWFNVRSYVQRKAYIKKDWRKWIFYRS